MDRYDKNVFGKAPTRFHDNLDKALDMAERPARSKRRAVAVLAVALVLLLAATAYAIVQHYTTQTITDQYFPPNTRLYMGTGLGVVDSYIGPDGDTVLSCYRNNSAAYGIAGQVEGIRVRGEWTDQPLDTVILAHDADGKTLWSHTLPSEGGLRQYRVIGKLPGGETLLSTLARPTSYDSPSRLLLLDNEGNEIPLPASWQPISQVQNIRILGDLLFAHINVMAEGSYTTHVPQLALYRVDGTDITELWRTAHQALTGFTEGGQAGVVRTDDGIVIAGAFWTGSEDDIQLVPAAAKLSQASGAVQWLYADDSRNAGFHAAHVADDGQVLLGGHQHDGDLGEAILTMLDADGHSLWQKSYAALRAHLISSIQRMGSGYVACATAGAWDSASYLLMHVDGDGNVLGGTAYTPQRYKTGYPLLHPLDGGRVALVGSVCEDIGRFASDTLFVSVLDENSFPMFAWLREEAGEAHSQGALLCAAQNSPNWVHTRHASVALSDYLPRQ